MTKAITSTVRARSECAASASSTWPRVISPFRTKTDPFGLSNYQELRQNLIARGHRFRTNSDTETQQY